MKPTRILIAYDSTECSRAMLVDMAQAGLPQEVDATVLTFAEVWLTKPEEVVAQEDLVFDEHGEVVESQSVAEYRDAIVMANEGRDLVENLFPQWRVTCEAHADAATWGTIGKVRQRHPRIWSSSDRMDARLWDG